MPFEKRLAISGELTKRPASWVGHVEQVDFGDGLYGLGQRLSISATFRMCGLAAWGILGIEVPDTS